MAADTAALVVALSAQVTKFEKDMKQAGVIARRRSCRTDTRCLWSESGQTLTFHQYPGHSGMSGVAGVLPHAARLQSEGKQPIEEIKETVSLADLLEQHGAPSTVHYLAMDIEGSEPEVLSTFDFEGPHRVLAVSIEGAACNELLTAAGFRCVRNPFHDKKFEHYFVHETWADSVREYLID